MSGLLVWLCQFHHRECTFQQTTRPRKRKITFPEDEEQEAMSMPWTASRQGFASSATSAIRTVARIDCYENFKGPTLLRKTLGLQTHRHATFLGPSSDFEQSLLHSASLHPEEISRLDAVETVVAPHGHELIRCTFALFTLVSPSCTKSAELASLPKPNTTKLEEIALRALAEVVHRPKLSTIQAGLLLLQQPKGDSWALTTQLVGIGQEIGLHLDCSDWSIPAWEKGLRKRLAWALFMQDKWVHLFMAGRLISITKIGLSSRLRLTISPRTLAEVEKGRLLFCEMVKLTEILSEILSTFYTLRAQREPRGGLREQLAIAKPIQIRLKEWFSQLPESVKGEDIKPRKLSSTELVEICRTAAKARLCSAIDFVSNLKPEHLQSFWYSPSYYNFSIISTFMILLWSTATTTEEASNASDVLERANAQLLLSTDGLTKLIPEEVVGRLDSPEESTTSHEQLDDPFDTPLATISSPEILQTLDVGTKVSSPTGYLFQYLNELDLGKARSAGKARSWKRQNHDGYKALQASPLVFLPSFHPSILTHTSTNHSTDHSTNRRYLFSVSHYRPI
ncbi:hypothetical protein BKA56DRAFT_648863 [Ilyonectria sp. MPI-CAGE-AT-0026]|nr:hypothetical protein BKA56DRAFT_648863 [Ilyonectria sp. MPI-CAGE-AT-0026]